MQRANGQEQTDATTERAPESGNSKFFDIDGIVRYSHSLGADVTKTFVRSAISSGRVPHLKLGKRFYVSREAWDRFLANNERRAR
jgi:hypothetical protein